MTGDSIGATRPDSLKTNCPKALATGLSRLSVKHIKGKLPFDIDGWVVLPDHMHCIWILPEGDDDFSNRWRLIKSHFSKNLPVFSSIGEKRCLSNELGNRSSWWFECRWNFWHTTAPYTGTRLTSLWRILKPCYSRRVKILRCRSEWHPITPLEKNNQIAFLVERWNRSNQANTFCTDFS